jgi:hypothetical protein
VIRDLGDAPGRLPWATSLHRVLAIEVLVCSRCAGPRRIVGTVTEHEAVRRLLGELGLRERADQAGRLIAHGTTLRHHRSVAVRFPLRGQEPYHMRQDNVTAHKGAEVTKAREGHQRRVSDLFRALLDSGAPAVRLADEEQARHHHGR